MVYRPAVTSSGTGSAVTPLLRSEIARGRRIAGVRRFAGASGSRLSIGTGIVGHMPVGEDTRVARAVSTVAGSVAVRDVMMSMPRGWENSKE